MGKPRTLLKTVPVTGLRSHISLIQENDDSSLSDTLKRSVIEIIYSEAAYSGSVVKTKI